MSSENEIRAIVLRGEVDHFCTGTDISQRGAAPPRSLIQH